MKVWAVTMVKDEADIIGFTIRHMIAQGVDGIIVADNMSTDQTAPILKQLVDVSPIPIRLFRDGDPAYYQSVKMSMLARYAAVEECSGECWIVPFDADELWYSWTCTRFADILRQQPQSVEVAGVPLWNHFCTGQDVASPNPFERMQWRQEQQNFLGKVCFRWSPGCVILQGNHNVIDHNGKVMPGVGLSIGIRHFPYRSIEQFTSKALNGAKAYAATNLDPDVGAHWRQYGTLVQANPEAAREIMEKWFSFADPEAHAMIHDPAPYRDGLVRVTA